MFLFVHSAIMLIVYLFHSIICPSVRPPFLPDFLHSSIQLTTNNLLPTDQYTLAVSSVTYQLIGYFLLLHIMCGYQCDKAMTKNRYALRTSVYCDAD